MGPILFLIFINDLDLNIHNVLFKFADDTKLCTKISTNEDIEKLEEDLNTLQEWACDWQMQFNVQKCKVMRVGSNIGSNVLSEYSMGLEYCSEERDLGVIMRADLKVGSQCAEACMKANKMLGLIKRTFVVRSSETMINLYKTMVRPHLEYCVSAWSPHYIKDRLLLEKVQHRFTRLLPGFRSLPYEERLHQLRLWTLEERRNRADLIEVFKMAHGLSAIPLDEMFHLDVSRRTRGHSLKLIKYRCNKDVKKYFFFIQGYFTVEYVGRYNGDCKDSE